jgi:hypothetical protein
MSDTFTTTTAVVTLSSRLSTRAKELLLAKGLAEPIKVVYNCIDSEKYSFSTEK